MGLIIKKISLLYIIWLSIFVISCNEKSDSQYSDYQKLPTYSVDSLEKVLPQVLVDSIMAFDTSKVIAPYDLVQTLDNKYWISSDHLENLIILFNQQGLYLAEAGGRGRGPGEFEGAKKLHVGWDNTLYVLDMRSQRITQYQVDKNGFTNTSSFSPSSSFEPASKLLSVYATEWGNYGVIRKITDYKKGEEEYSLFELDEEFRVKKRLFTMDGNEKMSLDRWNHIDHLSGEKTFWDLDGEWFYHITSHNTVVNKYNVRTGKSRSFAHLNLKDRIITDEVKLQLMDVASNMTERFDKIHEAFVDVEILPLFQDFTVHNNDYYMVIYNPSSIKNTEIIKVNEISGEVQYVNLPLSLWKVKAGRKMIYGTVTYGEDAQIRLIKFSE